MHVVMLMNEDSDDSDSYGDYDSDDSDDHVNTATARLLAGVMLEDEKRNKGKPKTYKKYPWMSPINRMMASQGTDDFFSKSELDWIDKRYEDSWDFAMMHELGNPVNPKHCEQAKTLITKLMKENP